MNLRPDASAAAALLALAACQGAAPRPIPLDQVAALQPPVALEAAGEPIDVTKLRGYPGPTVRDADGDGRLDLFVGSFAGKILLHRNVGSATAPVFARGAPLQAGGEDIRISNW
jgi:hypothetical protein